jgi:hypothetical protein
MQIVDTNEDNEGVSKSNTVKCKTCGREYEKSNANCCWEYCECGSKICLNCGSDSLVDMEMDEDDDEANYWCCLKCNDCGQEGCAMCV